MGKAGKSILWFLGACLAFANLVVGALTRLTGSVEGNSLLLFSFGSLLLVLATLVALFLRNPAFITAERGHLIPLELIQSAARRSDPALLAQLIATMPAESWSASESAPEADEVDPGELEVDGGDVDEDEADAAADSAAFLETLSKLAAGDVPGDE